MGVLIFGLVAMSFDLLVGYGGMVSFGHAAFFGLCDYATAVLGFYGIHSVFVAIPVAIGIAALAAFVIGGISLRTSGVYFIMITLAFAQMLFYIAHALAIYGGDDGLSPRATAWWRSSISTNLRHSFLWFCSYSLPPSFSAFD